MCILSVNTLVFRYCDLSVVSMSVMGLDGGWVGGWVGGWGETYPNCF